MSDEVKLETERATGKRPVNVKLKDAQSCPIIYANLANVTITPVDLQIVFSVFGDKDPGATDINATALIRVIMTPEHTALMLNVLQQSVATFIKRHGKLRGIEFEISEQSATEASTVPPASPVE